MFVTGLDTQSQHYGYLAFVLRLALVHSVSKTFPCESNTPLKMCKWSGISDTITDANRKAVLPSVQG